MADLRTREAGNVTSVVLLTSLSEVSQGVNPCYAASSGVGETGDKIASSSKTYMAW